MSNPGINLDHPQGGSVSQISDRLAAFFIDAVPLQSVRGHGGRPLSREQLLARVEAGLGRFYGVAQAERDAHGLGVIGQARVALGLQQRLLAAGYPVQQVRQVLFSMLAAAFVARKR
jgi:hypothetical protein